MEGVAVKARERIRVVQVPFWIRLGNVRLTVNMVCEGEMRVCSFPAFVREEECRRWVGLGERTRVDDEITAGPEGAQSKLASAAAAQRTTGRVGDNRTHADCLLQRAVWLAGPRGPGRVALTHLTQHGQLFVDNIYNRVV